MKISRRRFTQFLSWLVLLPFAKLGKAVPVPTPLLPDQPLTNLSIAFAQEPDDFVAGPIPGFGPKEGGLPARISVASTDAATDQPLYVYGGFYP